LSNVLIGIIGVILFIGLALAGALILGDDFRTASTSSQAAALMSQMKQAADAGEMYKLKTGRGYLPAIETDFLTPRFLKTPAVNPTTNGRADSTYLYRLAFNNNLYLDNFREPPYAGKWLVAAIGPQADTKARAVCLEIAQTYGANDIPVIASSDPSPAAPTGCILGLSGPDAPGGAGAWYLAYYRMERPDLPYTTLSGYTGG
jgi:hypothetical protein